MAKKKKPAPGKLNLHQQAVLKKTTTNNPLSPLEILATKCLDPLDVAPILKICANTLNNWLAMQLLPVSKVGRRRYLDLDDLLEMLRKGKERA